MSECKSCIRSTHVCFPKETNQPGYIKCHAHCECDKIYVGYGAGFKMFSDFLDDLLDVHRSRTLTEGMIVKMREVLNDPSR